MGYFIIFLLTFARTDNYQILRKQMIEEQIVARGIKDTFVLKAMLKVERHKFVPQEYKSLAYTDQPLPIGYEQTISQPYIVALMTSLLNLKGDEKVLEIGTGSGYQAAILAEIVKPASPASQGGEVYTIELLKPLAKSAEKRLSIMGYKNIQVKCGDGYKGWPKNAPFDGIIVTCAPEHIPEPLLEQLKVGGKMVIPVGAPHLCISAGYQELLLITKTKEGIKKESIIPVRFVPMKGEAEKK